MQRRINHKLFETNQVEKEKEIEARRRKDSRDARMRSREMADPGDIFSPSLPSTSTYATDNGYESELVSAGSSIDDLIEAENEYNPMPIEPPPPQPIRGRSRDSRERDIRENREYPNYIGTEQKKSRPVCQRAQQPTQVQILALGGYSEQPSRISSVSSVSTAVPARDPEVLGEDSKEILPLDVELPRKMSEAEALRRYLSKPQGEVQDVERTGGSRRLPQPQRSSRSRRASSGGSGTRRERISSRTGEERREPAVQPQSIPVTPNHRRTLALSHAIMTLALLSASASQLRFVIAYQGAQAYPALNYFLIATCIVIEILVGIGYVLLSRFEFRDGFIEKAHSYLIFGLFIVAVANIVLAAFALDDHICEEIALKIKKTERKDVPSAPLSSYQQPTADQNFPTDQNNLNYNASP